MAGLVVPLFTFVATTGFIVANAVVGALATSARRAGAVLALIGATQYGAGVIGAALVGMFADGTPWPLGWVVAVGGVGAAASAWLLLPSALRAI